MAARYPVIRPHNFERLLSTVESNTKELTMAYYNTLIERNSECRLDLKFTMPWIELLISSQCDPLHHLLFSQDESSPNTGIPRRNALHVPIEASGILMEALKDTDSFLIDRTETLALCLKHGFFKGALKLMMDLGKFGAALELSIELDDGLAFESLLTSIPSVIPAPSWPRVIKKVAMVQRFSPQFEVANTASNVVSIDPDWLVRMMSSVVGASETVDLLTNYESANDSKISEALDSFVARLSPDVFQQILRDGIQGEQKRAVVAQSLKAFDQNVWSKRSIFFGPQITNVEFIEKMSVGARENPLGDIPFFSKVETSRGVEYNPTFVIGGSSSTSIQGSGVSPDSTNQISSFYGEYGSHWGLHLNFSKHTNCHRCGLPLLDPRAGKVALFEKCAHAFHETCVEEDACPECVRRHFTSLFLPITTGNV